MALSDYEKQVLEEMEADLRRQSPSLDDQLRRPVAAQPSVARMSPRRIAAGIGAFVVGLLMLVGAVSLGYSVWSILLGAVGFGVMVFGIWWALRTERAVSSGASRDSGGTWSRFMNDQQERWEKRENDR